MRRTSSTLLANPGGTARYAKRICSAAASLLALGACGTNARLEEARREKAKVQISTVKMAAELAYMKTGKWPASLADVEISRKDDPWGHAFHYSIAGSSSEPVIFSAGPDGQPGNGDDVREVHP